MDHDLLLYACIPEKCSQPPQAFETFDIWAKHMRNLHSTKWPQLVHRPIVWRCDVDRPEDVPAFMCMDAHEFEEHLNSRHGNYSAAASKAISRTSRTPRRRAPNICLLCGDDVSGSSGSGKGPDSRSGRASTPKAPWISDRITLTLTLTCRHAAPHHQRNVS